MLSDLNAEKDAYHLLVTLRDKRRLAEIALALLRLGSHDVRLKRLLSFNTAGAGYLEPFLCAGLRLHLGHGA